MSSRQQVVSNRGCQRHMEGGGRLALGSAGRASAGSRRAGGRPQAACPRCPRTGVEMAVAVAQQHGGHGLARRKRAAPEAQQARARLGGGLGGDGHQGEPAQAKHSTQRARRAGSVRGSSGRQSSSRSQARPWQPPAHGVHRPWACRHPSQPGTSRARLRSAARPAMASTASPLSTCRLARSPMPLRSMKNSCSTQPGRGGKAGRGRV